MKIGKYYIETTPDCGDNVGGYFCRIYDDPDNCYDGDSYIDEHCVTPADLAHHGGLREALAAYLFPYTPKT